MIKLDKFVPHIKVLIIFFIVNCVSIYLDKSSWLGIVDDNLVFIDALYYTIITHTTVGYGDVIPKKRYLKMLGAFHSLVVFFLLVNEITELHIVKMPGIKRLFSGPKKKRGQSHSDNEIKINESDLELVIEDDDSDEDAKLRRQAHKIIKIMKSKDVTATI